MAGSDDVPTTELAQPDGLGSDIEVGRYTVHGLLGAGGMGRVFLAHDPRLRRDVALKLVRSEVLDATSTRRLIAEARAMAKLSHPNVVSVHDVEEVDGDGVVVVMEFVRGQTLSGWLRAERRTWREVVRVFVDAGRGLAAAHQVGLLHRDFKPANVLISEAGEVKVTDFGLAKSIGTRAPGRETSDEDRWSEDGSFTKTGFFSGTPRYMAPEQYRGRSEQLSEQADQYSFCVALWEALCGEAPFLGKHLYKQKVGGPPQWGTAKVPRRVVRAIMRGLAPEPSERWPSLNDLLRVLERDGVGRRALPWIGAAAVALVGVGLEVRASPAPQPCQGAEHRLDGVWDDEVRTTLESRLGASPFASVAAEATVRDLDGYADAWRGMYRDACLATAQGEQSPRMLDARMACLHRAEVSLDEVTQALQGGASGAVHNAHLLVAGLPDLEGCADLQALAKDSTVPPSEVRAAVEQARRQLAKSDALRVSGRFEESMAAAEQAANAIEAVEFPPVQVEVDVARALVQVELGRYDAARTSLDAAILRGSTHTIREPLAVATAARMKLTGVYLGDYPAAIGHAAVVQGLAAGKPRLEIAAHQTLAATQVGLGRYDDAEVELRTAVEQSVQLRGAEHPSVAVLRGDIAAVLAQQGRFEEAIAELGVAAESLQRSLGPSHPEVGRVRDRLGYVLTFAERDAEAEAEFRTALRVREQALGEDHPLVAYSRRGLAISLAKQGRLAEAEVEFRRALADTRAASGDEHVNVAAVREGLGNVLASRGRYAEAEAEYRASLRIRVEAHGADHPDVASVRGNLSATLSAQQRYEEAAEALDAAIAVMNTTLGPESPRSLRMQAGRGPLLAAMGREDEAIEAHRTNIEAVVRVLGPEHPELVSSRVQLAAALKQAGRLADAERELQAALTLARAQLEPGNPNRAWVESSYADVLERLGRRAEAFPFALEGWERLQRDDVSPGRRGDAAFVLARLLWTVDEPERDRARAMALALEAEGVLRNVDEPRAREVSAWLETSALGRRRGAPRKLAQ